jgi:hypothetical protein
LTALRWKTPERDSNVSLDNTGWLEFDYEPYGQTNAAIYALTSVTVEEDVFAICHLRANDDVSLFVNGTRAGSYRGRGTNGSSQTVRWRGPHGRAPDAIRFGVFLFAGRNEVLIKIRNRYGKAGCMAALSLPNGRPLSFSSDSDQPEARPIPAATKWRETSRIDSRSWRSKTNSTVGGFKTKSRALSGTSRSKGVGWRMFTVRPGFPKDSPSNLSWIKEKLTREHAEARVVIQLNLADRAPKLLLTLQGEGGTDGLSGWNLILIPHGKTQVSARLERYDRLVYQTEALPLPESTTSRLLTATLSRETFSATLDSLTLFDAVPIHSIPNQHRIGIATWGPDPMIERVTLSRPRP